MTVDSATTTLLVIICCCLCNCLPVYSACAPDSPHDEPFVPLETLPFCEEYQESSCCGVGDVKAIRQTVHQLIGKDDKCPSCYGMIREWKCAECSPQADIFHKGVFSQIRFCVDYCEAIFNTCKDIPLDISSGEKNPVFYLNEKGETATDWCQGKVSREPNCFRGKLPSVVDTECKCPSQQCHLDEEMLSDWDEL